MVRSCLSSPLSSQGGRALTSHSVIETEKQNYGNYSHNVVIYRNVKYSGTWGRWKSYIKTYFKLWLIPLLMGPLVPWMTQCHDRLLEILGFFYLVLLTPFHLLICFVLFVMRQTRLYLVKKYYPKKALVALDLSPRNVFVGKSLEMVTAIIMLKGKVDVQKLRSCFATSSVLRKKLTNLFGVRVFVDSKFCIESHIVEAPKEFLKYFVLDEVIYGKSALQNFVTKCASEKLNVESPPWKITIIPYPVLNKEREKTCCVLNFHPILLSDPQVNHCLNNIFHQCIYQNKDCTVENLVNLDFLRMRNSSFRDKKGLDYWMDQDNQEQSSNYFDDTNLIRSVTYNENSIGRDAENIHDRHVNFEEPSIILYNSMRKMSSYLRQWIYLNLYVSPADFKTWFNLQRKQFEYHGKSAIVKLIALEFFIFIKKIINIAKSVRNSSQWAELKHILLLLVTILRALCFVPIHIFTCFVYHQRPNELMRFGRSGIRRIAWSAPISRDLLKNIKIQTGTTTQSIVLTAIAASLKDYFSETNLPNPRFLGVMIPFVSGDLLSENGFSTLELPTEQICVPVTLEKLDAKFKSFAQWKLLGNYYIVRYISYILPRSLTNLVFQKIFRRYPISFTRVDLQPPCSNDDGFCVPFMSLWGKTIEEFCFWRPIRSDFYVSVVLVNYAEVLRISVLSTINSLDVALTGKFSQNLNKIAENVGVDKNLIPYSRKASPSSSNCSSPVVLKSDEK